MQNLHQNQRFQKVSQNPRNTTRYLDSISYWAVITVQCPMPRRYVCTGSVLCSFRHYTGRGWRWCRKRLLLFIALHGVSYSMERGSGHTARDWQIKHECRALMSKYKLMYDRSEFLDTGIEVRIRFPDFLRSSGSGTGYTQPREYNWGAIWKEK
jgi:hypothetical protein